LIGDQVVRDGEVEFLAIDRGGLGRMAVVAQCLDGYWVPRSMLGRMLERGESLADVAGERMGIVRAEYLRALVNARQVIVGRSALFNHPAVARDAMSSSGDHEALRRLLDAGVIVPFLLGESGPCERPPHRVDERGFAAWERLCREVRTRCLRLSWADEDNARVIRNDLHRRFGWFASGVHQLDVRALRRSLGLGQADETGLEKLLARVALWCAAWAGEGHAITREDLYRAFVVADESRPAEGRYDRGKPFAGDLKRLLDLRHCANLPDALERFTMVPADTLPRAALQEWRLAERAAMPVSMPELVRIVREAARPPVEGGAFLDSFGVLSLSEVEAIRATEAWTAYADSLDRLLEHPLDLADPAHGAAAVHDAYVRLAQVATTFAKRRNTRLRTERWSPAVELVVEVGGAALSVIPGLLGQDPAACQVAGRLPERAAGRALPISLKLVVRGLEARGSRADLAVGVHLLSGSLDAAGEQWRELLAAFGARPAEEDVQRTLPAERLAIMEAPEPEPT